MSEDDPMAVRAPQQSRSRRSLEEIYRASVELLGEGGWDAVKIGDVESRSGVSRGTLYWRFPSRDALVDYVRSRLIAEIASEQADAFESAVESSPNSLAQAVRAAVQAMARVFELHGSLLLRLDESDNAVVDASGMDILSAEFIGVIAPHLAESDARSRRLEFVTRVAFSHLVGEMRPRPNFPGHHAPSWEKTLDELARMIELYLCAEAT